jgi:hypothetical protein
MPAGGSRRAAALVLIASIAAACGPAPAPDGAADMAAPRTRALFNDGWRFTRGDPPAASGLSYEETKVWTLSSRSFAK